MDNDFSELIQHLDDKFTGVDRRFDKIDEKFVAIDEHFDEIKDNKWLHEVAEKLGIKLKY